MNKYTTALLPIMYILTQYHLLRLLKPALRSALYPRRLTVVAFFFRSFCFLFWFFFVLSKEGVQKATSPKPSRNMTDSAEGREKYR